MNADVRLVTRVSRTTHERETLIVRGRAVLAVLPDSHPLRCLLQADRSDLRDELKANAAALRDYLTVQPNERRTLAAILQFHQAANAVPRTPRDDLRTRDRRAG